MDGVAITGWPIIHQHLNRLHDPDPHRSPLNVAGLRCDGHSSLESPLARDNAAAAAAFQLLHLTGYAEGTGHLDETKVVEAQPAQEAANPVR